MKPPIVPCALFCFCFSLGVVWPYDLKLRIDVLCNGLVRAPGEFAILITIGLHARFFTSIDEFPRFKNDVAAPSPSVEFVYV